MLTESDPTPGTGFLWTFLHNGACIDFCFELEGRVWIGSANILILHSQDGVILSEEKNTNKQDFVSYNNKKIAGMFVIKNTRWIIFPQRKHIPTFIYPRVILLHFILEMHCSVQVLIGCSWLWHVADKWSIAPLREVYGKVCQTNHHLVMKQKLTGSLQTWTHIDFHVKSELFLPRLLWSLKFDMKSFCFLHSNSYKQPETLLLYGERYPLPRATQTVMRSFRLACQVQCNWLARLKRRYHSALLIRMWRGSHVPQFISTSADSLGMGDFL